MIKDVTIRFVGEEIPEVMQHICRMRIEQSLSYLQKRQTRAIGMFPLPPKAFNARVERCALARGRDMGLKLVDCRIENEVAHLTMTLMTAFTKKGRQFRKTMGIHKHYAATPVRVRKVMEVPTVQQMKSAIRAGWENGKAGVVKIDGVFPGKDGIGADALRVAVDPGMPKDEALLVAKRGNKVHLKNISLGLTETKDDKCRRICKSLIDGHHAGCPYAEEK